MAEKIEALRFAGLSEDGERALIEFKGTDGVGSFAFTAAQLPALFTAVCAAIAAQSGANTGRTKLVLEPTAWDLGVLGSGRLGVTFSLESTELTFAVPTNQIAGAIEALQRMLASPTLAPPPGSRRH